MKTFLLVAHLALAAIATNASCADLQPVGSNCDLASPPANAGELVDGGFFPKGAPFSVFPRAKDIHRTYSGCQMVWLGNPDAVKFPIDWMPFLWVEFVNGAVLRTWSPDAPFAESNKCRFDAGRLVAGTLKECVAIANFPLRSMRPGCLRVLLRIDRSEEGLSECRHLE